MAYKRPYYDDKGVWHHPAGYTLFKPDPNDPLNGISWQSTYDTEQDVRDEAELVLEMPWAEIEAAGWRVVKLGGFCSMSLRVT